jgi:hypothetical protein
MSSGEPSSDSFQLNDVQITSLPPRFRRGRHNRIGPSDVPYNNEAADQADKQARGEPVNPVGAEVDDDNADGLVKRHRSAGAAGASSASSSSSSVVPSKPVQYECT